MEKVSSWQPIVDKVQMKLVSWRSSVLSMMSRLTLIKAICFMEKGHICSSHSSFQTIFYLTLGSQDNAAYGKCFGTEYFLGVMRRRTGFYDGGCIGLGLHSCSLRSCKKGPSRILDLRNAHLMLKSARTPQERK